MNKYITKSYYIFINKFFLLVLWNITIPLKSIYIKIYKTLYVIKNLTFKEFIFNRIYGLIISILIFSDIIQYIYIIVGGTLYLILYIYIIIYIINLIYAYFYYIIDRFNLKNFLYINYLKIILIF